MICVELDLSKSLTKTSKLEMEYFYRSKHLDYVNRTFRRRTCQETGHFMAAIVNPIVDLGHPRATKSTVDFVA